MACFNGSGIRKRKHHVIKVFADVLCIALVVTGVFVIQKQVGTFQRGLFCDDESIKHPVKSDTISVPLVLAVGMIVPFVVILSVEYAFRNGGQIMIMTTKTSGQQTYWLSSFYNAFAVFIFGSVVTQFLTELAKHSVGRLRPHFYTLCDPEVDAAICAKGYITDFKCKSTDVDMLKEARLSFPSGHSSFAIYSAVYLILYLEGRIACRTVVLAKPVVQLFVFALAFFTCLSRISDYKHHWSDVFAGGVLGAAVSTSVVLSLTHFGKTLCKSDILCWSSSYEKNEENQATELVSSTQFENKFGNMAATETVMSVENESHVINVQNLNQS
ncbi:hypothetical protein EGW08_008891 [Elysia chlorotica]|uniref:Phosphatidic acid phosphatase type 2/haloperoxidase domain-containing protein n=1 Tax=Elysia chlorotica TaxID=188477 RepID=A0A433TP41_ELYCH|nr:hypothetical protein EGW08_008891 [Elysia chlorotica]